MVKTKYFVDYLHNWGENIHMVIDSDSCKNVISKEAVIKLKLNQVTTSKCCLVSLSIGTIYKDQVWSDVEATDACHLLLGKP